MRCIASMRFTGILLGGLPLLPAPVIASDIWITGDRSISSGTEITEDRIILDGGHLRYATPATDTLSPVLRVLDGGSGTVSVASGGALTVEFETRPVGGTLTFGSASDTGHLIISDFVLPGSVVQLSDLTSLNVEGGTVTMVDGPTSFFGPMYIAAGAELILPTSFGFPVRNLTGSGILDNSGSALRISGGDFSGTIKNVSTLSLATESWLSGGTIGSTVLLYGSLVDVGNLVVGDGVSVTAASASMAASLDGLGSFSIGNGSIFDLGVHDAQINSLTGTGYIGTAGQLTINGGSFDGTLAGALVFTGTTAWSGTMDFGGSVEVSAGATLTTSNAGVFGAAAPSLLVDGQYNLAESAAVGSISGAGVLNITTGKTLTSGSDQSSSTFSGNIIGAGGLVKTGAGTLTLSGTNSYGGGTTIAGGTLAGNSDSIKGNVTNNAALVFDQAFAGTYSGNIAGSGALTKTGTGWLTLDGVNTYTGGTTILTGTLAGDTGSLTGNVTNNAALVFDQDFDGTYSGSIGGTGSLVKTGQGALAMTGTNTFSGTTQIVQGTLTVNGNLASSVQVENGAILGGTGTVGGFLAQSGASVGPGNSIGTLLVAGNATFANGSTYVVEANAAGAADLVAATGTISIGPSAFVLVTSESGIDTGAGFMTSQTYRILSAAGGVTGTFGSLTDTFAYLIPTLSYEANDVYLTLTREAFTSDGNSEQENAVAGAVEGLGPGKLFDAILFLTDAERKDALNDLAGALHPSMQRALMDGAAVQQDALMGHLTDEDDLPFWTSATFSRSQYAAGAETGGFDQSASGIVFGADVLDHDVWRAGLLAGYTRTSGTVDGGQAHASADTFHAGLYGDYEHGGLTLRSGTILSASDISTKRSLQFSSLSENLTSAYMAYTGQIFTEASYRFHADGGFIEPFLGLTGVYQDSQSFHEDGGAAALSGRSRSLTNGIATAGIRFGRHLNLEAGDARLFGKVAWQHSAGPLNVTSDVSLGGSEPFSVQGVNRAAHAAIVEAGVQMSLSANADLSLSYKGHFDAANTMSAFSSKLSVKF